MVKYSIHLNIEINVCKSKRLQSIVNSIEISGRDFTFLNKYPQLINEITVQDVIKTANKYFSKPYVFTMVGPIKSIEKL